MEARRQKKHRNRRLLMAGLGIAVGLLCRALPIHYQWPCGVAAKALAVFLGSP